MDIKAFISENFVRFLALVCLTIGLVDAATLVGVSSGSDNPLVTMGVPAFVLLGVFTLARLFAAIGLWINASWGAALLIGATAVELGLVFSFNRHVTLTLSELVIRLALLIAMVIFLFIRYLNVREQNQD